MIEVNQLSYSYPDSPGQALDRASLEIPEGCLMLVAGGSGSGKSTLLKSMNGLVPHFHGGKYSGKVSVDGKLTTLFPPRDFARSVGFVGQDPEDHGVVDRVEDDIAFTLENLGVDRPTMRKRVEEVMDALGIERLRARRLDSLSGGERQRVAIAGALVAMPRHLVLDEITSQLDPQSAEEVLSALLRLRDEIGISIVLAEHRLERVLQYADELCLVEGGRARSGPPQEILGTTALGPPIVKLGRAFGWSPLPLGLRGARNRIQWVQPLKTIAAPELETKGPIVSRARDLSISIQGNKVLNKIELQIAAGELVAVMGRNGSGKTTLLRALAGLTPKHSGSVERPRRTAFLPQNPQKILFRSSVAAEIAATLKGRGQPHHPEAVKAEAERFRIGQYLDRHPRDLSAGEKTRVAIAAMAAGPADIVLMDEPTRGMDEAGKQDLKRLIQQLQRAGTAVVIATHDVELTAELGGRVVILGRGEIIVDAPCSEALASSVTFSTQMNKVFQSPLVLTLEDALRALGGASPLAEPHPLS
ncbi:MAG: ABC transporter ATP-binding protein [Actinomycetota bacterium]